MMDEESYVLVCDERGTILWPSSTKTWAMGGFITSFKRKEQVISVWEDVKSKLCEDKNVELKWSHFFEGRHQERNHNPLLSNDPQEWRQQAKWALSMLFNKTDIVPLTTYVRKDRASVDIFRMTRKGKQVLDINLLWIPIIGQFALFLKQRDALGEIWFDQLGSRKEESRKEKQWQDVLGNLHFLDPKYSAWVRRILPDLKFFDSKVEPLVQIADFVSGLTWAASEEDEEFLVQFIREYSDVNGRTYRLVRVE
jgi:hypothetical protein